MEAYKIVPRSEILQPTQGVLYFANFRIGPIEIQFQAIDSLKHPDIVLSGIRFSKRYVCIVNVIDETWYWHGTDDIENLKSFHNYLIHQMKIGKRIVVHDILNIKKPIAISWKSIETEPR